MGCGIAGWLSSGEPAAPEVVEDQLRALDHRGPDARGTFRSGRAVLGTTRLRIIDLETGDPPITNEDATVGVVLNGEIYNFGALTRELVAGGHRFRSRGDTETIAHLAEDLEPTEIAERLDGMFAFAVWDARRQRLVLGRDRLGKKPLYYWAGGGEVVFGSEIKALLAHPAVPRRLDPDAMGAYLAFGYVPTPRTFYEGIRSLPPGHVLVAEPAAPPRLLSYWAPPVPGAGPVAGLELAMPEAARRARALLEAAVEKRLVSDVPIGALLSGGIDSSAVVAVMSRLSPNPVRTFTVGFEGVPAFDERPWARLVARRFRTDHVELVARPDAVALIERLVWHYDQPFGDSSAIPTFLVAEAIRRHVTVALAGDGGDELFGGYERFAAALALERWRRLPAGARALAVRTLDRFPGEALRGRVRSLQRFAAPHAYPLPDSYRTWLTAVADGDRRRLLPAGSEWALDDYRAIWRETEGASLLDRLLVLNLRTYLLDDLLPKMDRMSMAHGLEVRSPFLDRDLLEFALRLPPRLRVRGFSRKRVLKAAVADLLPRETLTRRKRGFGVPLARWFREDLASYVRGMLCARESRVHKHLVGGEVERLVVEHQSGRADHGHALWTLLTLEVFLRREGW